MNIPWDNVTASGELIDRVRLTFSGSSTYNSIAECYGNFAITAHQVEEDLRQGKLNRETERDIEYLMATLVQIYYTLPRL